MARPIFRTRSIPSAVFAILLAGCATTTIPPEPLESPEKSAANFEARSLGDAGLHRFLRDNAGRDPGEDWDFETLTWAAFYFNPSLALARAQWASARAAELGANLQPNPTLTLTPGYNFTRETGISPWMPAINLDYLFSRSRKGSLAEAIAQSRTEAAKLAVFSAAWQVRADLRRALADTAAARQREDQLQKQLDAQRRLLSLLEQRCAAGGIASTDVSAARTALLRLEADVADAHGRALASRARIAAALGLPLAALEHVTLPALPQPSLPPPEALASARAASLHTRPDILNALARYHSTQEALQLEIENQVPDIHIGPGYQWDQGGNKWTLSLGVELPVFHRNEAGIAAAVALRDEAAAQFVLVQSQAIASIELSTMTLQAA